MILCDILDIVSIISLTKNDSIFKERNHWLKMKKKFMKTCLAAALSAALAIATVAPAFAADFTPKYTYSGDGMTFEKVSHANSPTETADGIVDYTGNGSIAPYVQGVSADGNGDRGQSYSYASASYGD